MGEIFRWVDTTGGPQILAATENIAKWRGIEGWVDNGPEDQSDYARGCRVKDWIGKVSSTQGIEVVVLSGDVGRITWFPVPGGDRGVLIQALCMNSEEAILALLTSWRAVPESERAYEEILYFDTGPSGTMRLFDSSTPGDEAAVGAITISLKPGRYNIYAARVETADCTVVLREINPSNHWEAEV